MTVQTPAGTTTPAVTPRDRAAALCAVAPTILLEECYTAGTSHEGLRGDRFLESIHDVARGLVELLGECLKGDSESLASAERKVRKCDGPATPGDSLEMAAAWDIFLGAAEEQSAHTVIDFVLDQNANLFGPLPMIDALIDRFPLISPSPLEGADMLACRHLMASTAAELKAIRRLIPGLRVVEVLGKPYSANRLTVLELERDGFPVNRESCQMPGLAEQPFGSYGQWHRRLAAESVQRYLAARGDEDRPLLVLDDGGALINAVGREVMAGRIRGPVVGVEQTTHGLYALDRKFFSVPGSAGFSVVPAAGSLSKLWHESPLIASSVLRESAVWTRHLARRGFVPSAGERERRTGIIGLGAVGSAILKHEALGGQTIAVFDRNRNKISIVRSDNVEMAWSIDNLLQYSDVIFSASGGLAIDDTAAESLRDGTVLMSASSGDREFRGLKDWHLEVSPILPHAGVQPFDLSHGLVKASKDGRTVYLTNRGFPVNFDGGPDPIPAADIQLTRALMVGAVMQAAGIRGARESLVRRSGESEYSEEVDRFIAAQFVDRRP